jgi:hypothetical protein
MLPNAGLQPRRVFVRRRLEGSCSALVSRLCGGQAPCLLCASPTTKHPVRPEFFGHVGHAAVRPSVGYAAASLQRQSQNAFRQPHTVGRPVARRKNEPVARMSQNRRAAEDKAALCGHRAAQLVPNPLDNIGMTAASEVGLGNVDGTKQRRPASTSTTKRTDDAYVRGMTMNGSHRSCRGSPNASAHWRASLCASSAAP